MYKEELLTVESYRSKEDYVALDMKIVAVAASVYGMCRSFSGWMFFTYFTNLSNIFVDIVLLVFAGFTGAKLNQFLNAMYKQKIPRVNLKAMLTEHNVNWDSVTLHDELAKEHEAMNGNSQK